MKSNILHRLIVCLILAIGYLTSVQAVTDAELEALEAQIEKQEAEEKKQAKDSEQKNAEQKNKIDTEAKRKKEYEANRIAEEEARGKAEGERLAEIERQRQEDDVKKKVEEDEQKLEEEQRAQFSKYMENGDSAMNNNEYTEALREYTQALEIFPGDSAAVLGHSNSQKLIDACAALIGEWEWLGALVIVSADGNLQAKAIIPNHGAWECTDPLQRKYTLRWVVGGWVDNVTLSPDGNTVDAVNNWGIRFQGWRKGTKEFDSSREIPL